MGPETCVDEQRESERLAALRATGLLDTPPEADFDELTLLASRIGGASLCAIVLVDEERLFLKSRVGTTLTQLPREPSFCTHAIEQRAPLVIRDTLLDERFARSPMVTSGPRIRFYAGFPLVLDDRHALGTLCVMDVAPRDLDDEPRDSLATLARQVTRLVAARRQAAELARTVRSLADSELRFRVLADNSSELIVRYAPDGRRIYVSPASRELLGWEPEEMLGRPGLEIVHPDDQPLLVRAHLAVLAGEPPERVQYRSRTKAGEYRWFESSARALRDPVTGELLEVQGATRDITASKVAEERLAESEARFRTAFEAGAGGLAFVSLDGRYLRVNRAFSEMLGFTEAELTAMSVWDLTLPEDRAAAEERFGRVIADPTDVSMAFQRRFRRKDGTILWVQASTRLLQDARGASLHYVSQFQDISALKEVDRMKDELVSTVAHELRTPLTSIGGALGLLDGGVLGALPAEAKEVVGIARASCDRLARLVNDLLEIEKMRAGMLELHERDALPSELVSTAVEGLRSVAEQTGVTLAQDVRWSGAVTVDVDRVVQVLTNLVSNALKFSPRGGEVLVRVSGTDDGQVRFSVRDMGPGIPRDKMPKLFSRFSQLDSSDARARTGSGLGLAICKAIVEEHGGRIGVESRVNEGSTFFFDLAAAATPVLDARSAQVAAALDELRVEYGAALPARAAELSSAVERLRAAPDDAASLAHAVTMAHRLGGTAGSYGFTAAGEHAGRVEDELPRTRATDPSERATAWAAIDVAMKSLAAAAQP